MDTVNKKTAVAMALLMAAAAFQANAQALQHRAVLTLEGAKQVVAAATAEARRNNAGGAIAVVDDGGNLILLERLDGTFAAGANVSIGKARTAALFKKPTGFFEKLINDGRTTMVALNDFTPLQGGVPITVDGQVVGGVGVSGANSAQQDEEIALVAANALQQSLGAYGGTNGGTNGEAGAASVTYFESKDVAAAFKRGQPLLEVPGYKIHASHRESAGMAEVHERDTDIIYVLDGTATFVTGGTVVDGQVTAPEEIRGREIADGHTYRLKRGDVIVVPNGVPHWFREVSKPFDYYVVKAN